MKNLQYFFLSVALTFLFGANISAGQSICEFDCDSLFFTLDSIQCAPEDCPNCSIIIYYAYREGECNSIYRRELYLYHLRFQNCPPTCQDMGTPEERFQKSLWCLLKNHNWEDDEGYFNVRVKLLPCMTTITDSTYYKRYVFCYSNDCCEWNYTLASPWGEPPYQYQNGYIIDTTFDCDNIQCNPDFCPICICNLGNFNFLDTLKTFSKIDNRHINKMNIALIHNNNEILINDNTLGTIKVCIYDIFGNILFNNKYEKNHSYFRISLKSLQLSNGIYFVSISTSNKVLYYNKILIVN